MAASRSMQRGIARWRPLTTGAAVIGGPIARQMAAQPVSLFKVGRFGGSDRFDLQAESARSGDPGAAAQDQPAYAPAPKAASFTYLKTK